MNISEIAGNVAQLMGNPPERDEFIYEFLLAYNTPKATISRLKSGQSNLTKDPGEILLKKKMWFRQLETHELHGKNAGELLSAIEEMKFSKKAKTNDPRFLMVTDFEQILAVDRKTGDTLDIPFRSLENHFDFFLYLAGMEKTRLSNENPADVKAAERMAKLFDAIKQDNPDYLRHDAHAMNVFLARLLFCLFAEDTGIFPENAVSNAIASHTAADGSDLDAFFKQLFDWLDTPDKERAINRERAQRTQKNELITKNANEAKTAINAFTVDFQSLPYVNGGLFRDHYDIPVFSARSRKMMIDAGELNWSEINPDIFGSMFQAVIDPEERHNLGQHYTSVTNIMKVIEPLFLNEFREELERAENLSQKNVRAKALHELHDRMAKVKIFDPACGSGNFLIIAYKELRKLEMELFEALNAFPVSRITVDQFYGIEISDFACETATLSLWLAEHQMNLEYQKRFKRSLTSLPLKDGAHIVCANACRKEWEDVCPKNKGDEIYILGNPPFYGSHLQTKEQKSDMSCVFSGIKNYKNLDYVACWFFKGAQYLYKTKIQCAFVATNSICQGEQVAMLWPHIFSKNLEIGFAHQSFLWRNNAKKNAAVYCVIIGIRPKSNDEKTIYSSTVSRTAFNINPYLTESVTNLIIEKREFPISKLPPMTYGNKPTDGGNLILNSIEKKALLADYPCATQFVRKLMGAHEFTEGTTRWCLWINDVDKDAALHIPPIRTRISAVREMRARSEKDATKKLACVPHKFGEVRHKELNSILVPRHGSDRRMYMPFGFLNSDVVVSDSVQVIYTDDIYVFGIISSRFHNAWIKATCGKIKEDPRYSSALGYNNFPIPDLTEDQKQTITLHVMNVLDEREKHSEKTMAQLYDPDKMPAGLREAHHQLDLAVDRLYRSKPFTSDEERLEHLFKLYEEMTAKEKLI